MDLALSASPNSGKSNFVYTMVVFGKFSVYLAHNGNSYNLGQLKTVKNSNQVFAKFIYALYE